MHDYEYQITNSIFVVRYSNCRYFSILLWAKTFFGIRKVTEYQVLLSKLTFNTRFLISNYQLNIRNSIFELPHISMETHRTCDFPRGGRSGPPAFIRMSTCFFMPPKELWEAYSNRTVRPSVRQSVRPSVRPSRFRVRSISPIFFEVGIPNLVCGYILGWRSVAYHFRVTVTLTLTSDLVFRIIVSGAYLLYYLR